MLMPFGKHKGSEVSKLPLHYRIFLRDKATIYGSLRNEVYRSFGETPPPEELGTIDEIQDRTVREVMKRFEKRERDGDCEGVISEA